MKKQLFTILLLFGGMLMSFAAQRIEVTELRLVREAGSESFYPRFTPDGKTILLTSEGYAGLRTLDLATGRVQVLTTADGVGVDFAISDDSRTVIVEKTDFSREPFGVRNPYSIDLTTQQMQRVISPVVAVEETRPLMLMRSRAAIKSPVIVYVNQDLKLTVDRNGQKTILTPNGADEDYIWASLSPDGTKIVYFVMSLGNTFVSDLNGNILVNLGSNFHAPQWINNDWIVGMDDKDNGRVFTESNIVAVTANGEIRQNLTQPGGKIELFPVVSPSGNQIAFHTTEGELYIMEISVQR